MMYDSWGMKRNRQNFFSFWDIFLPFYPTNNPKIFGKMKKNPLEISSFYTSVPKIMIICYTISEIWCMTGIIVIFCFELLFALLAPNNPKNQNLREWNICLEISSYYICVPKITIRWCMVPEIQCATNGQTDWQTKKWHLEVGAPPKNVTSTQWKLLIYFQ